MAAEGELKVLEGFLREKNYRIPQQGAFRIGRDRHASMPIMSRKVSREHARITYNNGVYTITDLDSKGGTFVNQRKVKSTVLRDGDLIQIANVKMRFVLREAGQRRKEREEPVGRPVIIPPRPAPAPEPGDRKPAPTEVEVPAFSDDELALVGRSIGGVKLIAALARGRRTLLYKGIQPSRNRVVAFKMLNLQAVRDPAVVRWFITGAQHAGQLRHEDAVAPFGGGREGSYVFVYSPFMENRTARERFAGAREEGLAAVKAALEALIHVARALEFGHSKGVLHLGLRPSKVLYNENRRAKLNGLGFDNGPGAPGATMTPEVTAYLAPEQISVAGEISAATDIFSLGACFYYMLTGRRPPRDHRHRIPSPKEENAAVPDSICRIIERMVNPAPEGRYRYYGELLHDLRWALRGEAWPRAHLSTQRRSRR